MMDTLVRGLAGEKDRAAMDECPSYDYQAQTWREWSDHGHFEADDGPLLFCGADGVTCRAGHPEQWEEE